MLSRLTSLVKYFSDQELNIIVSANLTSQIYRNWCRKNIKIILKYLLKPHSKI